jgi:hypothetical protein
MLLTTISEKRLEADLAAGAIGCPDCGGRLSPWGFARSREVRMRDGVRALTPRRACCQGCGATHVLAPSWSVPRRRDGAEVIGEALAQAALGAGHRSIGRRLGRPAGTVRGWLRAARARAEEPAGVRRQVGVRARPRPAGRGHSGRQRAGRRGRGDHARREGLRAAVRSSPCRSVGAGGVSHGRASRWPAVAAAVAPPSGVVVRQHDLIAVQLRTAAAGQAPQPRPHVPSPASFGA